MLDNDNANDFLLLGDKGGHSVIGHKADTHHVVLLKDEDSDSSVSRFKKSSSKTHDVLKEMFGENTSTKQVKSSLGISLDQAQSDVLKDTWRSDKPSNISAFRDSYRFFCNLGVG